MLSTCAGLSVVYGNRAGVVIVIVFVIVFVVVICFFFFFNDTATTEIYTLSLHDALPI